MDSRQEWCRLREYVEGLEEERRKILAFERELPLCLQLVTHAIESCKQQIGMDQEYSDCEAVSSEERVMEEFIPMKTNPCMEDGHHKANEKDHERGRAGKRDWLNSAQLWNTQDHHNCPSPQGKGEPMGIARKKEEKQPKVVPSSTTNGCDKERQIMINKKTRRSWSPDLHKSFLQALQQLGGAHVATPKQIREVMRVDGLTNDEVKSHLQKYRLHAARRPSPTTPCKSTPPSAQFVVVGGLWIPPPEYSPVNAAGVVCTELGPAKQREPTNNAYTNIKAYTPVARVHQCKQQSSPVPRTNIGVCSFRSDLHSSSSAISNSSHTAPTPFYDWKICSFLDDIFFHL